VDEAALGWVDILHGILDGDDVACAREVDLFDERGERGAFSRAGRAGHDDEAVAQAAEIGELGRQAELFEREKAVVEAAERDGRGAVFAVDIEAVAVSGWRGGSRRSTEPSASSVRCAAASGAASVGGRVVAARRSPQASTRAGRAVPDSASGRRRP
jgi:general stress protein YciG